MTEYHDRPTRIGEFISDDMSTWQRKVRLRLSQKDRSQGVILNLKDMFFLPRSPSNLVSLALLNNNGISYNNKNETLYDVDTKEVLAQAKKWNDSFLLQALNLSDAAVSLTKRLDKRY